MTRWHWTERKLLTVRMTSKLADRLAQCSEVTRLNEGRWREEWALALCFDGVEDSARAFLDEHLPKLMRRDVGQEDFFDLLLVEICEDLRHTLHHIREPKFYRYLRGEKRAGSSLVVHHQLAILGEQRMSKARVLKEVKSHDALRRRLAQLAKVTQYDDEAWNEADAIVRSFVGLEVAFRGILEDLLPQFVRRGIRPDETYGLLLQIGEQFLGILQSIMGSRFYWYLLEPLDSERAQSAP